MIYLRQTIEIKADASGAKSAIAAIAAVAIQIEINP
jgi:hypothetical protein